MRGGGKRGFLPRLPSRVSIRVPLTHDSRDPLKWRSCSRVTRVTSREQMESFLAGLQTTIYTCRTLTMLF